MSAEESARLIREMERNRLIKESVDIAQRQRALTIQSAREKLHELLRRLETNDNHEGRELVRGVLWDLMDLKAS